MVQLYEKLQRILILYKVALVPFNTVGLKSGFEGICVIGLGTDKYEDMADVLGTTVEMLLKTVPPKVLAMVVSVESESRNGYDTIWRILRLYVAGFDPTKTIVTPAWEDSDRYVHVFVNLWELYFYKRNHMFNDLSKSTMFLKSITGTNM